jgi:hypothetical protein
MLSSNRLRAACLALVTVTLAGGLAGCGGGATDPATTAQAAAALPPAQVAPALPLAQSAPALPSPPDQPAPAANPPTLQSVSPSVVIPPARIVLSGEGLDQVESVRLGDIVLPIVSRTPAWLEVDVPAGATTQFLTLIERNGTVRSTPQVVTIDPPAVVTLATPTPVLAGSLLTLSGSGLDRIREVAFAGDVTAAVQSPAGSTTLRVVVPLDAVSGPLGLISSSGRRFDWPGPLTVIPRIRVSVPLAASVAAGAAVTISGSGLGEVSAVTVAGQTATIGARSATRLAFSIPTGGVCGAVTLVSASQPSVFAGTVSVGTCTTRIESIEYAQVLSQPDTDARQRLVPRRETWVRAYVVSGQDGVAAPLVTLNAFVGSTPVGTRTMTGPASLPTLAAGLALPSSLRADGMRTFMVQLEDAWVIPGLRVEISMDARAQGGTVSVVQDAPQVGADTRLTIVLVPLISGIYAPTLGSDLIAATLEEIARRFPIARDRIAVSVRAPYTLRSVTNGVDSSADWSFALQELEQLRSIEATGVYTHYYGLIQPLSSFGIVGVGYVGPPASAMGIYSASDPLWKRVMTHELGHNFNREHAPCRVSGRGVDTSYPYPNGALGPTPLFDAATDQVVSPAGKADAMGYCDGDWFSDYTYSGIQTWLEARPQEAPFVSSAFAGKGGDAASELVLVSGAIGLAGSRIDSVQAVRGVPRVPPGGEFVLRLNTLADERFDVPFDATAVDHASPPERHFQVRVPDPGPLRSIEVLRGGVTIVVREGGLAPSTATKSGTGAQISADESGGALTLAWDAVRHPTATIVHVAVGGARTGLAVRAQGGRVTLRTDALPAGGAFEIALSDGLNTERMTLAR